MTELSHQPETGIGTVGSDLTRRPEAEALGTALLLVTVVGSGIIASRLSPDNIGLQLLENAAAIARTLSNTFAGIAPSSAPMFIVMHLVGAAIAYALITFLYPPEAG